MRVLHVHSGNIYGGIETMLLTLAREQQRQHQDAMHVALCFDGRLAHALAAAGAGVSILGEARLSRPGTARSARAALVRVLSEVDPHVVVMHAPWARLLFARTVERFGSPIVAWMHGPSDGWMALAAAVRHRPAGVVCNSAFTAGSIPRVCDSIPRAIIHCPSEPPDIEARAARHGTRREMGCAGGDVVVAQVSRLEAWKGHEIHLRALGRLGDVPGWVAWIVGSAHGPRGAKHERMLRGLAARLGIAHRVKFLGYRDDVPRLLAAADVYCQPNVEPEPFGLSYVEALAAGLPVIASDLGGAREILTSDTGFLVPARDESAVEAALRRLILDPSERARLGAGGPARAAALCDPARQLQATTRFLRSFARRTA